MLHMRRNLPCGSRVGGQRQATRRHAPPEAFTLRSILVETGLCTPKECPRTGQMWEEKPDNWPEGRQTAGRSALYK